MDRLSTFGLVCAALLLAGYALERRTHWGTLAYAAGFAMGSGYAFLARVWIIGIVAFAGYLAAMNRWVSIAEAEGGAR